MVGDGVFNIDVAQTQTGASPINGLIVTFVGVPEPSTFALLSLGLVALTW